MKKNRNIVVVILCLGFFVVTGCSRSEKTEMPAEQMVQPPVKSAVQQPVAKPTVRQYKPPANESTQYLQACLKSHPENRKYCECFASQMQQHVKPGATEQEKGKASGMAALSCRKLK